MAQETEEQQAVETAEPTAEAPEAAEAPAEGAQEETQAEPETEEAQEEPKKKRRKGGFLLKILYILLVIVFFLEAGVVYFWFVLERVSANRGPEEETPVQQTVTSSAYANWAGSFRPPDWPEAVAIQVESPPVLETEGEDTAP